MSMKRPDGAQNDLLIRAYQDDDADAVQRLFIKVNRLLAPPDMMDAFEGYIERSLTEEIGRVGAYFAERDGGFWVAISGGALAGMFGLEPSENGMELRRMYVDPSIRRRGVARRMLTRAEQEARSAGAVQLDLSTSELQEAALGLYQKAGYELVRKEVATTSSNKVLGGGLTRFHFVKKL